MIQTRTICLNCGNQYAGFADTPEAQVFKEMCIACGSHELEDVEFDYRPALGVLDAPFTLTPLALRTPVADWPPAWVNWNE